MLDALMEYSWPGNIRQLQNMIYQFIVLGKLDFIAPQNPETGRHCFGNRFNAAPESCGGGF